MICPCYSARIGVFMLVLAACHAASSQVLLGVNLGDVLRAVIEGNISPGMWLAAGFVGVGVWQLVRGLRAAFGHNDPIRWRSLLWSVGAVCLGVASLRHLSGATRLTPFDLAGMQAFLVAWVAENAVNIGLQLRGLFPRRPRFDPFQVSAQYSLMWEQATEISVLRSRVGQLRNERDALAHRLAHMPPPSSESDFLTFVEIVGGKRMVLAPWHPDREKDETKKPAATVTFQKVGALLERAGVR